MKERLVEFLKYLGVGQDKFAKSVGLSRGYVNNIGNNITMKTIGKILRTYPELNENWLLTGEGEMLNKNGQGNMQPGSQSKNEINCVSSEQPESDVHALINSYSTLINSYDTLINGLNSLINGHNSLINGHNILINNQDKLLDIFKALSINNNPMNNKY